MCGWHYRRYYQRQRLRGDLVADVPIGDLARNGRIGVGRTLHAIARGAVAHAVQTGRLQKPDRCERCGRKARRLEAHHHDYEEPLDVEWLCVSCHRNHHVVWLPAEVSTRLDALAAAQDMTRDEAILWLLEAVDA